MVRRKVGTSDGCRLIVEGNRTWAFQWGKKGKIGSMSGEILNNSSR